MNARWVVILSAVVWCAGCAKDRSPFDRPGAGGLVQVNPAEIASSPDAPEPEIDTLTFYRAGRFHESTRNFEDAVKQYRNAIESDPNFVDAYARLGIVFSFMDEREKSEQAFLTAIRLRPDDANVRNNLGFAYLIQERWADAEAALRRALVMNPDMMRARINLGAALAAQSRYEEALTEYRAVLPEADAQYNIALAYRTNKRYTDARKALERTLEIDPAFEAAREQLARLPKSSGMGGTSSQSKQAPASKVTTVAVAGIPQGQGGRPAMISGEQNHESPTRGDINGDGRVDLADFADFQKCMAESAIETPQCVLADFDGDGRVDLVDYQAFQSVLNHP